jgi:hypothetical protein
MTPGQLGVYIATAGSGMVRGPTAGMTVRDGGLIGFYVQGGTQGVVGLYDVATSASVATAATILASATVPVGWNWLPVAFTNGLYISNPSSLPITCALTG